MGLPEAVRKLIPLLGSPIDGEVVAAARAIERMLKKEKLDWHDFTKFAMGEESSPPIQRARPPSARQRPQEEWNWWSRMAQEVLDSGVILNHKERYFLNDIRSWKTRPSEKQEQWLRSLRRKVGE